MVDVYRPGSLAEALELRAEQSAVPFGGGTDLMVRYRAKNGLPPTVPGPVMFVDTLDELRTLRLDEDFLEIGASVPLAILADDPGERKAFAGAADGASDGAAERRAALEAIPPMLQAAAWDLGAPALRQRATMAGNVANASPAGDTVAALSALDASVCVASVRGERLLPIGEFIVGPGRTLLAEDEIITAFRLPRPLPDWGYWRKVGTRRANALTKVSLAAAAWLDGGRVGKAILAFGAVGPTVVRVPAVDALLAGRGAGSLDAAALRAAVDPHITPIDDQRSTARYRKTVALNLIDEALRGLETHLKENS